MQILMKRLDMKTTLFCGLLIVAPALFPGLAGAAVLVLPDKLPPARVGEPYRGSIEVACARTPVSRAGLRVAETLPEGLRERFDVELSRWWLEGIPVRAGVHALELSIACFGTQTRGETGQAAVNLTVTQP